MPTVCFFRGQHLGSVSRARRPADGGRPYGLSPSYWLWVVPAKLLQCSRGRWSWSWSWRWRWSETSSLQLIGLSLLPCASLPKGSSSSSALRSACRPVRCLGPGLAMRLQRASSEPPASQPASQSASRLRALHSAVALMSRRPRHTQTLPSPAHALRLA